MSSDWPQDAVEWGELLPEDFGACLQYVQDTQPSAKGALLRSRFRYRKDEFLKYCWPERFSLPFNEMHRHLFEVGDIPPWDLRRKPDTLHAVAAPRGMGKSAVCSFGDLVHAIVYDLEAFIVLISSGRDLVWDLSADLLGQFKPMEDGQTDDRRLSTLYGPFQTKGGKSAWSVSVKDRPPIAIATRSFGQDIRGIKHPSRGIRPTLIVLDDAEKKDRVRNPDQRTVWESTLTKDILKLSDRRRGSAFRFVGTILHTDSILSRRMRDPGWKARKYAAILEWPSDAAKKLWEECRQIWADLTRGDARRLDAVAYYEKHREKMDEGAVLLDPEGMPLFQLYELIWSQGYAAFLQEMQNEPVDPSVQVFNPERFSYFTVEHDEKGAYLYVEGARPRIVRWESLTRKFTQWDPSEGSLGGDPAAIATVARDAHGYKYVLNCWMALRPPSTQREALWSEAEAWGCARARIESNGFQDLAAEPFERERTSRREEGRFWRLDLEYKASHQNKEERIASSEPEITNGWLLFNRAISPQVFAQYSIWPSGDHDDGPDAIQGASSQLGGAGDIGMTS